MVSWKPFVMIPMVALAALLGVSRANGQGLIGGGQSVFDGSRDDFTIDVGTGAGTAGILRASRTGRGDVSLLYATAAVQPLGLLKKTDTPDPTHKCKASPEAIELSDFPWSMDVLGASFPDDAGGAVGVTPDGTMAGRGFFWGTPICMVGGPRRAGLFYQVLIEGTEIVFKQPAPKGTSTYIPKPPEGVAGPTSTPQFDVFSPYGGQWFLKVKDSNPPMKIATVLLDMPSFGAPQQGTHYIGGDVVLAVNDEVTETLKFHTYYQVDCDPNDGVPDRFEFRVVWATEIHVTKVAGPPPASNTTSEGTAKFLGGVSIEKDPATGSFSGAFQNMHSSSMGLFGPGWRGNLTGKNDWTLKKP